MISFENKKILITGATGGIGNELVKKIYKFKRKYSSYRNKSSEKLDIIKKKYPNM